MPAIREFRRAYPSAHITLVTPPQTVPIAELCLYVDEMIVRPYTPNRITFETDLVIFSQLLERKFDIAFYFTPVNSDGSLFMYLSGARERVTYEYLLPDINYIPEYMASKYFLNLATKIFPAWQYGDKHAVDLGLSMLDNVLLAPVPNREMELWSTTYDKFLAKSIVGNAPRPLYGLMLGTDLMRRYPAEKYAELVKMILSEEPTATFVNFGGGKADAESAQILREHLGEEISRKHVINLVNRSNFRIDGEILKMCDMYIGNNTSTMHLAAAAKCPSLVAECFPADLPQKFIDVPRVIGPYRVPTVAVQPKHALPECAVNEPYNIFGCRTGTTHCIAQIKPETLFKGYHMLRDMVAQKKSEHLFIT